MIKSIPALLYEKAKIYKNKVAMCTRKKDDKREITYTELFDRVIGLAVALERKKLKKGDMIALIGANSPEWTISYLAIQYIGGTAVPIDRFLKPQEIKHILVDSKAKAILYDDYLESDIEEATEKLKVKKLAFKQISELYEENKGRTTDIKSTIEDLAVLIYTSGTTGQSKGVMLTHKNIVTNIISVLQVVDIRQEDISLSILPMHHTFAATTDFLGMLYSGAKICFSPSLKSRDVINALKEENITILITVPLLLENIVKGIKDALKKKNILIKMLFKTSYGISAFSRKIFGTSASALFSKIRKEIGFNNIRLIVSGGAALPIWVSGFLENLGLPIIQGYGLTESSPVLTVNPLKKPINASVGKAIPGVELKIHNPQKDGVGELIARGDNIMLGYYQKPEETKKVLKDGWLYTGDLARIDNNGYVYIQGRKKNIIVTAAGKNISPEEIEEHLLESDFIKECLIVGRDNPSTGREEVHAIIYPDYEKIDSENPNMTEEEIERLIEKEIEKTTVNLSSYKRIKHFEIREEEFPKTTTKKIKRFLFTKKPLKVK